MADERKKADWLVVSILAVALLCVPILYVLSAGPAIWLLEHGYLSEYVIVSVYYPLDLAAGRFELAKSFFDWYLDLWGV